ncbi:MAG TPA: hypothetical protein H9876_05830 [Candidatus Limosilactobacillus merdipullorum]|uniref:Glycine cleavage system protein H n=1 Tax=Candidatus Limosilactobacillus merdipullorum TaxID=2838653 RepID=A0A9D1QRU2_9LACO|nr:hypothetical protein [Candidatus Limosilactobacillus merdipullorum]
MKTMDEYDDWWLVKEPSQEGTMVTIGFLSSRIQEWGHLLFLDLPMVGAILNRGDLFVSIEAANAITFSASPVTGKIIAINPALNGWVNHQASGSDWLMKLLIKD